MNSRHGIPERLNPEDESGRTDLITGGAGFIGSHLADALIAKGRNVRILDNFSSGKRENIEYVLDRIELVEGDLRDADAVRQAVEGVDVIFHQAAVASVPRSISDPTTTFDANVTGTLNLLLAARDAGARRVVFASSSSIYGDTPTLPKVESMKPEPLSPYAISKLTGEQLCRVFTNVYGLETVALRYFNVFGPRQDPNSQYAAVIPRFLAALRGGVEPVIYGDGEQSRDFTFIENVVDANLRAASTDGVSGGVFNVASGRAISVNAMLTKLAELVGVECHARFEPPRQGDVRDSLADITAARSLLCYEPRVSFEAGLERLVAHAAERATV